MKTCRLSIWIKGKPILQGKYYTLNGKPVFLANIDEFKLWTTYNGYSIANQLLEAFSKAKIRPLILYHYAKRNLIYKATPSDFTKYGIQIEYGEHRQIILPLKKWHFFHEELAEPYGLPKMTVDEWLKEDKDVVGDVSAPISVMQRLKEEAIKQGWYKIR
jgi:hypothetical protein